MSPLKPKLAILGLTVLSVLTAFPIARAAAQQQPSVVGLWQKVDENKPVGWFLFVIAVTNSSAIAKLFPRAKDDRIRSAASVRMIAKMRPSSGSRWCGA
jgi:hypothetical protein